MAEEIKTPMSEFTPSNKIDDKTDIIALQDGNNVRIDSEVLSQQIINKINPKFVERKEKGQPNGVATLDENGKVPSVQLPPLDFTVNEIPIDKQTLTPTQNGVFIPTQTGIYPNFGGLEYSQQEFDNQDDVRFIFIDGRFEKQVKSFQAYGEVKSDDVRAVGGDKVYDYTLKEVKTIAELRTIVGEENQTVRLLGYYEAGDKPPLLYKWVSGSGEEDGGSVIVVGSGYWKALFSTDGICCRHFGAHEVISLSKDKSLKVFRNWTNYVNNTDNKYFNPAKDVYFLYEPLYVKKSFVGIDDPTFMYISSEVGKVVNNIEKTAGGNYDFNVKAVIGINPLDYSDAGQRLLFCNFKVMCTNEDNDTAPSQDYGVYFPQGTSFKMENITVIRPTKSGFVFKENWMANITRLNTWGSRYNGFEFIGTFTSLFVSNCYAHTFKNAGFYVNGAVYSTFSSLGADNGEGDYSYIFASCSGSNVMSIGSEECKVRNIIAIGNFQGTVSGIFFEKCTVKDAVIDVFEDSVVSISGIKSSKNNRPEGKVDSFRFQSSFGGVGNIVNIYNDANTITLGDYISYPNYLTDKGKYVFNIKSKPYCIWNNVEIKNTYNNSGNTTPELSKYEDGFIFYNTSNNSILMKYGDKWKEVYVDEINLKPTFSPNYSQNTAFGEASLVKKGNEVFYKVFANKSTNVEVGDTILTLQPELRPKSPEFIVGHGGNGSMVVWLMIEPSTGAVKVKEFPNGSGGTVNAIVMSGSFFIRE